MNEYCLRVIYIESYSYEIMKHFHWFDRILRHSFFNLINNFVILNILFGIKKFILYRHENQIPIKYKTMHIP